MKISEITAYDVACYLRLEEIDLNDRDISQLNILISVAKKYILDETGLTAEEADEHEDFSIVVFVLCQDMYDNRTMYVEKTNINKVVDNILGMHRRNLL